ncbi:MAG TPA: DNA N-6-adenine-methyltransferase [Solirubrobacterales bacterium]|nr:DNA N-6-adenine-methyltransferase [Solirubrobacterales bacterium]
MSPRTAPTGFRHEPTVGGSVEWYTPPELFAALGLTFDLDPASPPGGLPWVPAVQHFSRDDDGLSRPWHGRVWLNPPYGRRVGEWLDRLAVHGDGMALVFARTDTAWFERAFRAATAACFVRGRLHFISGDGRPAPGPAAAPSLLLAYGLSCSLALAASELGRVCIVPKDAP